MVDVELEGSHQKFPYAMKTMCFQDPTGMTFAELPSKSERELVETIWRG